MLKINYVNNKLTLTIDPEVLDMSTADLTRFIYDLSSDKLPIMFTSILSDNLPQNQVEKLSRQCGTMLAQYIAEDKILAAKSAQEAALKPIIGVTTYDPNS